MAVEEVAVYLSETEDFNLDSGLIHHRTNSVLHILSLSYYSFRFCACVTVYYFLNIS